MVQQARPRFLHPGRPGGTPFWHAAAPDELRARRHAAARLDSLSRLLGVMGAPAHQVRARRLRDALLAHADTAEVSTQVAALRRRLQRSRTMRWSGDGLGMLPSDAHMPSDRTGRRTGRGGDVTARWQEWLLDAERLLSGCEPIEEQSPRGPARDGRWPSATLLERACELMIGLDLAAARIVLASFDPDPDELAADAAGIGPTSLVGDAR